MAKLPHGNACLQARELGGNAPQQAAWCARCGAWWCLRQTPAGYAGTQTSPAPKYPQRRVHAKRLTANYRFDSGQACLMWRSVVPPPVASRPCWCGDHASAFTAALCDVSRNTGPASAPPPATHTATALSLPPLASCRSSGAHCVHSHAHMSTLVSTAIALLPVRLLHSLI